MSLLTNSIKINSKKKKIPKRKITLRLGVKQTKSELARGGLSPQSILIMHMVDTFPHLRLNTKHNCQQPAFDSPLQNPFPHLFFLR